MSEFNADKQQRGAFLRDTIDDVLKLAKDIGYINEVIVNYKTGKPGYEDEKQFKAPFLIRFYDGNHWILFTTTSIRERVKSHYWDAHNLKELDDTIKAAYLVYPDSINLKERRVAEAKNNKIQNHKEYSSLEGIVSQNDIFRLIEDYALCNESIGKKSDAKGTNFEKRIIEIINNKQNLEKWQTNNELIDGLHYDIFIKLMKGLLIDNGEYKNIALLHATDDKRYLKPLPSGGSPKTDIILFVKYRNSKDKTVKTVSCKRTGNKNVSIHQYSADTFADVLDKDNDRLRELLRLFQFYGNRRDMGEANAKALEKEIAPYVDKLIEWALMGKWGDGEDYQRADYIIVHDDTEDTIHVHTFSDYIRILKSANLKGMFGTPFGWTYQGKRGTNIQLKCRIVKE